MSLPNNDIFIADNVDTTYLDDIWLDNKRIKLLPASEFRKVPHDHLRIWLHRHARYSIPTLELITWLKEQIGDRKAIEVASGNGDLGYHLGIIQTDSYVQTTPEYQLMYGSMRQPTTKPTPDVKKLDAVSAIQTYKPKVVIASWLSRKFDPFKDNAKSKAHAFGPKEEWIVEHTDTYIHIGNKNHHGTKTILSLPHQEFSFDWIVSRGEPSLNVIYRWDRARSHSL